MKVSHSELSIKINEKILQNWLDYLKLFTPIQSNFLSHLFKRYRCLDSGSIVLFFAKKTHQAIMRKKEYDLNYDLSFEKFWQKHNESDVENLTIIEIAKNTNLPKETTRRKLAELTKIKVFIKIKKNIIWLPSNEYKKTYNEIISDYNQEWLILLEIYEILFETKSDIRDEVKKSLTELRKNDKFTDLIDNGLKLIE